MFEDTIDHMVLHQQNFSSFFGPVSIFKSVSGPGLYFPDQVWPSRPIYYYVDSYRIL